MCVIPSIQLASRPFLNARILHPSVPTGQGSGSIWALAFPSAAAGLHPNPQQKPQVGFPESSIPGTNSMTFHH